MIYTELKTIRDFIRYATSLFNEAQLYFGHGTDNAWDEATAIILHTLHLPHHINPTVLEANLTRNEKTAILSIIEKRIKKRIPAPYLTNEAWFSNLSFYVDERVLIPRSPIAELILQQFEPWILSSEVHSILDLCTGCGCIAIACAKAFTEASIDASDISSKALAVAKINLLRHDVENQVELFQSDLFENIPPKKYDIIVSNPPYVSEEEMQLLFDEFKHEPALGLAAGKKGLDIVNRILKEAGNYLQPDGILVVEVGNSEKALIAEYPTTPFIWPQFERGGDGVFILMAKDLPTAVVP